jgi:hypothetical protein
VAAGNERNSRLDDHNNPSTAVWPRREEQVGWGIDSRRFGRALSGEGCRKGQYCVSPQQQTGIWMQPLQLLRTTATKPRCACLTLAAVRSAKIRARCSLWMSSASHLPPPILLAQPVASSRLSGCARPTAMGQAVVYCVRSACAHSCLNLSIASPGHRRALGACRLPLARRRQAQN